MISRFFIDRPIFATVLSVLITLVGFIALSWLPMAQYPRITPPGVSVTINYPGASAGGRRHGGRADRAAGQRHRGHALHVLADGQRRFLYTHRHLRHRHRCEHGARDGAKSSGARDATTADPGSKPGNHHPQEDPRHPDDGEFLFAQPSIRRHLPEQFRHDLRQGRAAARLWRLRHQLHGPARLQHPGLARPAEDGVAQHHSHGCCQCDPHREY